MITISSYTIILMMSLGLVIVSSVLYIRNMRTDKSFLGKFGAIIFLVLYLFIFHFLIKKEFTKGADSEFGYLVYGLIILYFALSWFVSFGWYKKDPPE